MKVKRINCGKALVALLLFSALVGATAFGQSSIGPITTNAPVVTVTASDADASESGPDTGAFTIRREGGDTNTSLNVFFHLGGTAINGVDYDRVTNIANFPAGALSTDVVITPIDDDIYEGTETVILEITQPPYLTPGLFYQIGIPGSAGIKIADNDPVPPTNIPPVVRITSPTNGSAFTPPADILIFADANDLDGTVETVEFFAGTNSLGVVTNNPMAMSPINPWHVLWTNVSAGVYALRTKATDDQGAIGWSEPVRIVVGEQNLLTIVSVVATDPDAEEIPVVPPWLDIPQRVNPAVFTISRSDHTNSPLTVYFHMSGTASNGVDYETVGDSVTIPEGSLSADVVIDPIDDFLVEGTESVILTLEPVACPAIFPPPPGCYQLGDPRSAIAFIRDNDTNTVDNLPPKVVLTKPTNDTVFPYPSTITLEAEVTDPDGYSTHVDFFANDRKIGESDIAFFVQPPPGQTITFSFDWVGALPGLYSLRAVATDNLGALGFSEPVHIAVTGTNPLPPIVTITAIDPFASEGTNYLGRTNTATFAVRHSGPTNSDLTVFYGISGTASNGVDYQELPGVVTIPAGSHAARIVVRPIDDNEPEPPETVVLSLRVPALPLCVTCPPPYIIGFPGRAAAVIVDNDGQRPPIRCLSDGLFHACFPGTNGFGYRLEICTNLVDWVPVCTNIVTDGAIDFIDPDTTDFEHRFYRAVPDPNVPTDGLLP